MNFDAILTSETVLLDLRSPEEFSKGAFPNSVNLPLLDDEQRRQVGICYKAHGQQAAVDLGNQLINPELKTARIHHWLNVLNEHPDALLYCWRGGLRSRTVKRWLSEAGREVPVIPGGFKALRSWCLDYFENLPKQQEFLIIAGRTGSGKTPFINQFFNSIDLEGLANHRGSAFGRKTSEQPSTINFEHALAIALLRIDTQQSIIVEDESRIIGRLAIPQSLFNRMSEAPVLVLESTLQERSLRIFEEYVAQPLLSHDSTREQLQNRYLAALERIKRRLGGQRCADITESLQQAFALEAGEAEFVANHLVWIEKLLNWYYDPMYDYQLSRKQDRVILTGDCSTIESYLRQRN